MFRKKKVVNPCDAHADKLLCDIQIARQKVITRAQNAIAAKGVIDLYPEGRPDRNKAVQEFDEARWSLLDVIAEYDTARMVYNHYIKAHVNDFDIPRLPVTGTSHDMVAIAYKNFFKKG